MTQEGIVPCLDIVDLRDSYRLSPLVLHIFLMILFFTFLDVIRSRVSWNSSFFFLLSEVACLPRTVIGLKIVQADGTPRLGSFTKRKEGRNRENAVFVLIEYVSFVRLKTQKMIRGWLLISIVQKTSTKREIPKSQFQ